MGMGKDWERVEPRCVCRWGVPHFSLLFLSGRQLGGKGREDSPPHSGLWIDPWLGTVQWTRSERWRRNWTPSSLGWCFTEIRTSRPLEIDICCLRKDRTRVIIWRLKDPRMEQRETLRPGFLILLGWWFLQKMPQLPLKCPTFEYFLRRVMWCCPVLGFLWKRMVQFGCLFKGWRSF